MISVSARDAKNEVKNAPAKTEKVARAPEKVKAPKKSKAPAKAKKTTKKPAAAAPVKK